MGNVSQQVPPGGKSLLCCAVPCRAEGRRAAGRVPRLRAARRPGSSPLSIESPRRPPIAAPPPPPPRSFTLLISKGYLRTVEALRNRLMASEWELGQRPIALQL